MTIVRLALSFLLIAWGLLFSVWTAWGQIVPIPDWAVGLVSSDQLVAWWNTGVANAQSRCVSLTDPAFIAYMRGGPLPPNQCVASPPPLPPPPVGSNGLGFPVPAPGLDQSAAIQTTLNAGGLVHLPAGAHTINQTLFIPANVILEGDGPASILLYTGTGPAVVIVGQNTIVRATLRDFRLTTLTGTVGVRTVDLSSVLLERVYIDGFTVAGVHLTSNLNGLAINIHLRDCFLQNNPGTGLVGDATFLNANTILGGRIQGNGQWGIILRNPTGWMIHGVDVEGNRAGQVALQGLVRGVSMLGNYCENEPGFPLNCPFDPATNFVLSQ